MIFNILVLLFGVFLTSIFAASPEKETLNLLLRQESRLGLVSKVNALVKKGAAINGQAEFGETALFYATLASRGNVVKRLLELGANPNISDSDGVSPLMNAASICDYQSMRLLLKAGAVFNQKDSTGKTALMSAAEEDCLLGVLVILEHGKKQVDLDSLDGSFRTARDYAHNPWIKAVLENARNASGEKSQKKKPIQKP